MSHLSARHAQTIVTAEVHKTLRDEAYEEGVPLRDMLRDILTKHAEEYAAKVAKRQPNTA